MGHIQILILSDDTKLNAMIANRIEEAVFTWSSQVAVVDIKHEKHHHVAHMNASAMRQEITERIAFRDVLITCLDTGVPAKDTDKSSNEQQPTTEQNEHGTDHPGGG